MIALGVVRLADDGSSGSTSSRGDWQVVTDVDRVFAPPPGGAVSPDGSEVSENTVFVNAVIATEDGFVAVGSETRGFTSFAAVWHSADGTTWARSRHDPSFGHDSFSDDSSSDGPRMVDIAEHDGTFVVAGALRRNGDDAVAWVTEDLDSWRSVEISTEDYTRLSAVAAGPNGFVLVGSEGPAPGDAASMARGWISEDFVTWTEATFEDEWGSTVEDVIAIDDGWIAAGSSGGTAAVWTSSDGLSWIRADVDPSPTSSHPQSAIHSLVSRDGVVLGLGSAAGDIPASSRSGGTSYRTTIWRLDGTGTWTSAHPLDDGSTFDGPIVATPDEFVAFAADIDFANDGIELRSIELRSTDGIDWAATPVEITGGRLALADRAAPRSRSRRRTTGMNRPVRLIRRPCPVEQPACGFATPVELVLERVTA